MEHGLCECQRCSRPAQKYILTTLVLDAAAFFTELSGVMHNGVPDTAALNAFGVNCRSSFSGRR